MWTSQCFSHSKIPKQMCTEVVTKKPLCRSQKNQAISAGVICPHSPNRADQGTGFIYFSALLPACLLFLCFPTSILLEAFLKCTLCILSKFSDMMKWCPVFAQAFRSLVVASLAEGFMEFTNYLQENEV